MLRNTDLMVNENGDEEDNTILIVDKGTAQKEGVVINKDEDESDEDNTILVVEDQLVTRKAA